MTKNLKKVSEKHLAHHVRRRVVHVSLVLLHEVVLLAAETGGGHEGAGVVQAGLLADRAHRLVGLVVGGSRVELHVGRLGAASGSAPWKEENSVF